MSNMNVLILNGPNLNLLGIRNKEVYGVESFEQFMPKLQSSYTDCLIAYKQTNVEGEIINILHDVQDKFDVVILNAGGYTHTSVAIADAVEAIVIPVIEVHISQIYAREPFRQVSLIAKNAVGTISGFGLESYSLAMDYIIRLKNKER